MSAKRARKKHQTQPRPDAVARPEQDKLALTTQQAGVILAIGLLFGLGVIFEWGWINGFSRLAKSGWPWQDLGTIPMGLALLAPFLLIAAVLWGADRDTPRVPLWFWLTALVVANFCLQLFSVLADPRGADRIPQIVMSESATSYFGDALNIHRLGEFLSHFDRAALHGHSTTHPAGPILFYYFFARMFSPEVGALLGGCSVGLIASLGIIVMYAFAGLWTSDRRVRLLASAFYALLPALTVFFPELDQIYPIFSMLIILTFVKALNATSGWYRYALASGAMLFIATFFAYNLLTTGAFLFYYGIYCLFRVAPRVSKGILTFLRATAVALIATVSLYLLLWAATGYNAPASFRHSLVQQDATARWLDRPYHVFVFADLYDFALAAGMIALPILYFYLRGLRDEFKDNPDGAALTLIGLATVLTVDLSGLLRGETARVWLFLQPLWVAPIAIELARARRSWRFAILAMQWWLLVLIKAKMSFIEP